MHHLSPQVLWRCHFFDILAAFLSPHHIKPVSVLQAYYYYTHQTDTWLIKMLVRRFIPV